MEGAAGTTARKAVIAIDPKVWKEGALREGSGRSMRLMCGTVRAVLKATANGDPIGACRSLNVTPPAPSGDVVTASCFERWGVGATVCAGGAAAVGAACVGATTRSKAAACDGATTGMLDERAGAEACKKAGLKRARSMPDTRELGPLPKDAVDE